MTHSFKYYVFLTSFVNALKVTVQLPTYISPTSPSWIPIYKEHTSLHPQSTLNSLDSSSSWNPSESIHNVDTSSAYQDTDGYNQQILGHDSPQPIDTANDNFHVSDGRRTQNTIAHLDTLRGYGEVTMASNVNIQKIKLPTDKKKRKAEKQIKSNNKKSKTKRNNLKRRTSNGKKRNRPKSKPERRRESYINSLRRPYLQTYRNGIRQPQFDYDFDESRRRYQCVKHDNFRREPLRRPLYNDYYDYYYNLPPKQAFRYRYRNREPLYDELEDLSSSSDDYHDSVEDFNESYNDYDDGTPARQVTTTTESTSTETESTISSTTPTTTTVSTTTTSNDTNYGYGPSNGNENISITTALPGNAGYGYFEYGPPNVYDHHHPFYSNHHPQLSFSSLDGDLYAHSATEEVVQKVRSIVGKD